MKGKKIPNFVTVDSSIKDLLKPFISNRKAEIDSLEKALNDDNWEEVSRIAHVIHGVSGGYGFDELGAIGAEIEIFCEQKNKKNVFICIEIMRDHLDNVQIIYT